MKSEMTRRTALCFSSFAAVAPQEFTMRSYTDLVVLDIAVEDGSGKAVTGLPVDAFQVFEDGRRREVKHFAAEVEPVTAGLVLDMSGSMTRRISDLRAAVTSFLNASTAENEYFIVTFNDAVHYLLPPSEPFAAGSKAVITALARLTAGGRTSMNDGLASALDHIRQSKLERRVILLVSDGRDTASRTTHRELMAKLRSSQATVHAIALFDPEDLEDSNQTRLREIAGISGGLYIHPLGAENINTACVRIARDIRARYTLSYTPASPENVGARRIRKVKVGVNAPGVGGSVKVRTRTQIIVEPGAMGG